MNEYDFENFLQNMRVQVSSYRIKRKFHSKRRPKRSLRKYCWESYQLPMNIMEKNKDRIFIGASDYSDFVFCNLVNSFEEKNQSFFNREIKLHGNRRRWYTFIEDHYDDQKILEINDNSGYVITKQGFFRYNVSSNSITVEIYGSSEFIEASENFIFDHFEIVTSYIEWVYSPNGETVTIPLNMDKMPIDEMYPFLKGETLQEYYDRFLNSTANILLLIGPPGTGKTTFIRGLIAHSNSSALVTYDAAILEKDYVFARFIEDNNDIMVLEDSDNFLNARQDGNTMMHRFLNVGDGLVTTKGKKLIFSTNLPSVRDIDPALIRPGRCFDILTFDNLQKEDAVKLAAKVGVNLTDDKDSFTIAEVFNKQTLTDQNKKIGRKLGFI